MTARISLSRGLFALIDAEDLPLVGLYKWYADPSGRTFYAKRNVRRPDGRWTTEKLHQLIMGTTGIDHVNGDGLDNRRVNLRPASSAENNTNRRKQAGTSSQFKGVSWFNNQSRWAAQIKVAGRALHIGRFGTEHEAALAYDAAARHHFGEFAALNFPAPGERPALDFVPAHKSGGAS